MQDTIKTYLATAERVVRAAGDRAERMLSRARGARVLRHKPLGDIVTDGDLAVEEDVISSLSGLYPDHGFESEEREAIQADAEYVWVLDPIDGSKYYARNVPLYSVSLALLYHGAPVIGVVYSPALGRMYSASAGSGAKLNGKPIRCSGESRLDSAFLCVEIPCGDASEQELRRALQLVAELVSRAFRVRMIGVAALGLAFCAAGGFDAYVNLGSAWKACDVAAGRILVQEGGGVFSDVERLIVAGPNGLCDDIRAALNARASG